MTLLKRMNILHRVCHGLIAVDLMEQGDFAGFQYYIKDFLSLTEDECKPQMPQNVFNDLKASQLCLVDYEPKNKSKSFLEAGKKLLLQAFSYLYSTMYVELNKK